MLWKPPTSFLLCFLACVWRAKGNCSCKPCGPIPGKEGFSFVGFATSQDPARYTLFDFSKLTTVVILGINDNTKDFVCYAHARNVKVVLIAHPPTGILWRKKMRAAYIDGVVKTVTDNNLDGINMDYEGSLFQLFNPLSYNGLTSLMKEFRAKLQALNPRYELSMDWVFCPNCQWGRSYDYNAIKNFVDYFVVMFYDMQWGSINLSNGLCEAHSQNRFDVIEGWANLWAKASGIPKQKLVFAFPWYGHVQKCYSFEANGRICYTKCSHINRSKFQHCYRTASKYLYGGLVLGGKQWNHDSKSPFITWRYANEYYRMNYDDPFSLKLRYDLSLQLGVRGVGAWHITCLDFANTAAAKAERTAMWAVIPTGKAVPAD